MDKSDLRFFYETLLYMVGSYDDPWKNFTWTFEDINNFISVYWGIGLTIQLESIGLFTLLYMVGSYDDPWNFTWTFEDINNFMSVY